MGSDGPMLLSLPFVPAKKIPKKYHLSTLINDFRRHAVRYIENARIFSKLSMTSAERPSCKN
jgi:hypothetical protein